MQTKGDLWDAGSREIHKGPSSTAFNIKYSFRRKSHLQYTAATEDMINQLWL